MIEWLHLAVSALAFGFVALLGLFFVVTIYLPLREVGE